MDLPRESEPKGFAIFGPCFTCNRNIKTAAYLARGLAERGIGVLRIDFRGLGESEGDFKEATLSSNVADLVAAAEFLKTSQQAPALLVGHSFGGPAVIRAAARLECVRAVVTINSPADPRHVTSYFADKLEAIERDGFVNVDIVGRPFPISAKFIRDLETQNHPGAISDLGTAGKALLVCHAPSDDVVPFSEALEAFELAREPKNFLTLDRADHYLFKREDADWLAGMIAAWAARYLA